MLELDHLLLDFFLLLRSESQLLAMTSGLDAAA